MIPDGNQRWAERRDSYRPPGEPIRTSEYEVAEILGDAVPRAFVEQHHYSACYPAARARFGLYHRGELAGVAVLSHPCRDEVLTSVFPGVATDSMELGRFVLLDSVPGNGETWFLARVFEHLRKKRVRGVVSFSDPHPRTTSSHRCIFAGHVGTIYQAHNACYLGQGQRRTLRLLPDGSVFSARAMSKIRAGERGWRYSAEILQSFGADACPDDDEGRREWLSGWLRGLTRPIRHVGNHKYAWALSRDARVHVSASQPYPKRDAA